MSTKLTVIGSSNWSSENGGQPAFVLQHDDTTILVDCGDGTLRGLATQGFKPTDIDAVFITHTHPDHVGGLVALLVARWLQVIHHGQNERERLAIFGPPNLEGLLERQLRQMGSGKFMKEYGLNVRANADIHGHWVHVSNVSARPFRVDHAPRLLCYGYRFLFGFSVVSFSGDMHANQKTNPAEIRRGMQRADILVIEAGASQRGNPSHLHTSEAFAFANAAQAKHVVLTHTDTHLRELAHEAADKVRIKSKIIVAEDGTVIELP